MITAKEATQKSDYVSNKHKELDVSAEGLKILKNIESLIEKACEDGLYAISYSYYFNDDWWYYDRREFKETVETIVQYLVKDLGYNVDIAPSWTNGSVTFIIKW